MNVFMLSPRENWIIDRIASELLRTHPEVLSSNILNSELIWLAAGWCWNQIHPELLSSKKVIATIHHEVPEKFDKNRRDNFLLRDKYVDHYHVPAQKTKDFISKFTKKPITVLGYWYDNSLWHPANRNICKDNLGILQNDFVIGSFQRDTEGSDLVTPKLEKGPDLFCDYVEKLKNEKSNIHVLLGAWRRQYVINRLKKADIKYTYIELAPIEKLREMYGACDLYVVASRHEGGPQSILECAAMKVPIISTDVGMASEVLSKNCIVDIRKDVYFPSSHDIDLNYESVKKFELKDHSKRYVKLFKRILSEH